MQIKRKLPLITVLLVIVPLLVVNSLFYYMVTSVLKTDNALRIHQLLHTETAYLEQFFEGRKVEAEYIAENFEIQQRMLAFKDKSMPSDEAPEFKDAQTINDYLHQFVTEKEYIKSAFIISHDGFVLGSSAFVDMTLDLSDRTYYQKAMSGETNISNLVVDRVTNDEVFFVATPVFYQGSDEILGVFSTAIDLGKISDTLMQLVSSEFDSIYLLDSQNNIVFHSDTDKIGEKVSNLTLLDYYTKGNHAEHEEGEILELNGEDVFVAYHEMANIGWKLIAKQRLSQINATTRELGMLLILIAIIADIITFIIIIRFTRTITNPISDLTAVMDITAKGDLGIRAQYTKPNELGKLAKQLNEMLDELVGTYEVLRETNEKRMDSEDALKEKVNALELSERSLKKIQGKYTRALDSANDIIWEWYPDTGETYFSKQWYDLIDDMDFTVETDTFFAYSIIDDDFRKRLTNELDIHMANGSDVIACEFKTCIGNPPKWFLLKGKMSVDEESGNRVITGILGDITLPKENEARIIDLAFVDQLTRLPNRTAFNLEFNKLVEDNQFYGKHIAVCMMDIDDFKTINDRFGHRVGDQIIEALSKRFIEMFEGEENITIYRVSGDEFAFVVMHCKQQEDVLMVIKKIYTCLSEHFEVDDHMIKIYASTGIAIYPEHGGTAGTLVQNADTAVYRAKEKGKGKYVFFKKQMSEYVFKKYEIEKALQGAISEGLVYMVYQPQYDVIRDRIVGYEALMRMVMKDGKMVSPVDFIPIAEETGKILELGEWSIRHVCEQIKKWHDAFGFDGAVAINVSGVQLKQHDFSDKVAKIIKETGVAVDQITFEITESIFMETNTRLLKQMEVLKQMGIKLSLDDFGTGYSSFSYLRMLPLYSVCLLTPNTFILLH